MPERLAIRHALRTYLFMVGARSFLFWTAFITGAIYYIQAVGMNPLQLVLVGTVLELTVFVCEIPTGIVADVYGRKRSLVTGFVVIGLGFVLQGAIPRFGAILAAQILYGSGSTFISGAEEAWLADEIGIDQLPNAYLRGKQVSLAASFAGVFSSASIATAALNYPFLFSGIMLVSLAGVLAWLLPETGFRPAARAERSSWRKMTATLTEGIATIRQSSILTSVLMVTLFYGVSREGIDRLWEAHILSTAELPLVGSVSTVVWFGVINALAMLMALSVSFAFQRWIRVLDDRTSVHWLVARYGLLGIAIVAFGLIQSFWGLVAAFVCIYTLREVGDAVQSAWVNRNARSAARATALSTINQMDAVGQAGGGPLLGAIGLRLGLRTSMVTAGAMLVPVLALLLRLSRHRGSQARFRNP